VGCRSRAKVDSIVQKRYMPYVIIDFRDMLSTERSAIRVISVKVCGDFGLGTVTI